MMISGCTMTSGATSVNYRASSVVRSIPPRPCSARLIPRASLPSKLMIPGSLGKSLSSSPFAASLSPIMIKKHHNGILPWLPTRKSKMTPPRASKDIPSSWRFPTMEKKPKFCWRILACIPYLMPLHETWIYAESAYNLHPFLEYFERVTFPFHRFIGKLPNWFQMAYFFLGYLFIVRRKEWPHFFRFHVILGMLLGILLQVLGTASRWVPTSYLYGKLGMYFWVTVVFAHLFTVLECIRCATCGMYADVPFASDAAYIQIPYD